MPEINTYNTKAAGEALKLHGGELLMSSFLAVYNALVSAEQAGYAEGHAEGYSQALDGEQAYKARNEAYDNGYADGHDDGHAYGFNAGTATVETSVNAVAYRDGYDEGYADGHYDGSDQAEGFQSPISTSDSDLHKQDAPDFDWELVKAARALDEHERGRDAGIEAANASEPEDVTAHDNKQVEGFNFPEGFVLKAADIKASPLDNCPF